MSGWESVRVTIEAELLRWSQEVDSRRVLPNRVAALLPWSKRDGIDSVLAAATAELGEVLVAWARREGHAWYRDIGPFLTVELAPVDRIEVRCEFVTEPPVTPGGSADRSGR